MIGIISFLAGFIFGVIADTSIFDKVSTLLMLFTFVIGLIIIWIFLGFGYMCLFILGVCIFLIYNNATTK
jgi:hypothetical protein